MIETSDAMHTYNLEERATFARAINQMLSGDPDVADRIPMNPDDDSLFHIFDDGIAMCKIVSNICNCIDDRSIKKAKNLNVF